MIDLRPIVDVLILASLAYGPDIPTGSTSRERPPCTIHHSPGRIRPLTNGNARCARLGCLAIGIRVGLRPMGRSKGQGRLAGGQ